MPQFGMYIMFPIGIMYYFGTNLDSRFAVPDFWPKEDQSHKIPFEREEIKEELERLKARRLARRAQRLEMEQEGQSRGFTADRMEQTDHPRSEILDAVKVVEPEKSQVAREKGWSSWFR
jgi:protein PET100, fungi type